MESAIDFKTHCVITYSKIQKAVADKINYHWIDVPCCQTCEYVDYEDEGDLRCQFTTYQDDVEIFGEGNKFNWFVESIGLCDHYKKRTEK
jgi:hypothetical protein